MGVGGSRWSRISAVNSPPTVVLSTGEQAVNSRLASRSRPPSPGARGRVRLELLAAFVKIEREWRSSRRVRTTRLLRIFRTGDRLRRRGPNTESHGGPALRGASAQNATVRWSGEVREGQQLRQMGDRVQSVNTLLSDEIVLCASSPGSRPGADVMARVKTASGGLRGLQGSSRSGEVWKYSVSTTWSSFCLGVKPGGALVMGQGAGSPLRQPRRAVRRGARGGSRARAAPVLKEARSDNPQSSRGMVGMK